MLESFAHLRLPSGPTELGQLIELAKSDKHGVFYPTDIIEKDNAIAGYFSVAASPMVLAWLSTKQLCARDSFHLINTVETIVSRQGFRNVVFPVPKDSPFHPVMESLKYGNHGSYDLFVKVF